MAIAGPIIIVEDDADDEAVFGEILKELNIPNKIVWFIGADEALSYLRTTADQPFIIFSDVNLPKENGIEFKRRIDADAQLRKKSIPFVFYSTFLDQRAVNEAYTEMTVQGFFKKGDTYSQIKDAVRLIIDYWRICVHPNTH